MNIPLTIYITLLAIILSFNVALRIYSAWGPTKTTPATAEELARLSNFLAIRSASAEFLAR